MFRESMKTKTIEAKEKYQENRKKVKHMGKVNMKQFYQKIIEKHAAKSHRKFVQIIKKILAVMSGKKYKISIKRK